MKIKLKHLLLVPTMLMTFINLNAQTAPPVGTPCITMTVTYGATVKIRMLAAATNTPVWVESTAGNYTSVKVNTGWTGDLNCTTTGTCIKVHGNLTGFDCCENSPKLMGLDLSNHIALKELRCEKNSLKSLDVSGCTTLTKLNCSFNSLTSLNINSPAALKELDCSINSLTNLDVSNYLALKDLNCSYSIITNLNVSGCTALTKLICYGNSLTSLNISNCTALKMLDCYNNPFSTQALDDIYCQLPNRTGLSRGRIVPVYGSSPSNLAAVIATNKSNAINKNWSVQLYDFSGYYSNIPATTGNYVCGITKSATDTKISLVDIDIYPNPASDKLSINTSRKVSKVEIYTIKGKKLITSAHTADIDISSLNGGLYLVKIHTDKGRGEYKIIKQ